MGMQVSSLFSTIRCFVNQISQQEWKYLLFPCLEMSWEYMLLYLSKSNTLRSLEEKCYAN